MAPSRCRATLTARVPIARVSEHRPIQTEAGTARNLGARHAWSAAPKSYGDPNSPIQRTFADETPEALHKDLLVLNCVLAEHRPRRYALAGNVVGEDVGGEALRANLARGHLKSVGSERPCVQSPPTVPDAGPSRPYDLSCRFTRAKGLREGTLKSKEVLA